MEYNFKIIKNDNHGLKKEFLREIQSLFSIDTFIETGTYLGHTTKIASEIFNQVHSIELSEELFEKAQLNLGFIQNITLYKGDSAKKISEMIDNSSGKLLFWLDGHYSGGETAKGDSSTAILSELEIIRQKGKPGSVILVDDLRFFDESLDFTGDNQHLNDYPGLRELISAGRNINKNYNFVVLGDVGMFYDRRENVRFDSLVKALTILRLRPAGFYDESMENKARDFMITNADKFSGAAEYLTEMNGKLIEIGIGNFYYYLSGLVNYGLEKYKEAIEKLKTAKKAGFDSGKSDYMISLCNEKFPGNDEPDPDYDSGLLAEVIAEGNVNNSLKNHKEFASDKPEIINFAEILISKNKFKQAYRSLMIAELQFPGNLEIKKLLSELKSGLKDG